jgi:hypothetical protein
MCVDPALVRVKGAMTMRLGKKTSPTCRGVNNVGIDIPFVTGESSVRERIGETAGESRRQGAPQGGEGVLLL